jgi:transcriptional regulator with XRE-family HTH domain
MLSDLLRRDRERSGLTIEQAARRLGLVPEAYQELESGEGLARVGDVRPRLPDVRLAADVPLDDAGYIRGLRCTRGYPRRSI